MRKQPAFPYWSEDEELGLIDYRHTRHPLIAHSHHEIERVGLGRAKHRRNAVQTALLIQPWRCLATGHAWHDPGRRVIVLNALIPNVSVRVTDPRRSRLYHTLWTRYEQHLMDRFPDAQQLFTTWEDQFPREQWEGFLSALGYHKTQPAVFVKDRASHAR